MDRTLGAVKRRQTGLAPPDFVSAETVLDDDAQTDFAHSLGVIPSFYTVSMTCTTDNAGYVASTSDEVIMNSNNGAAANTGVTSFADATNVSIVHGDALNIVDASSFDSADIVITSWRWVVRAWK